MKRRDFLSGTALSLGAAAFATPSRLAFPQTAASAAIRRVLVVFKCHLDVGFTDTQAKVIQLYFHTYFPQAIQTAASIRTAGSDRYVWTTGSWLLYQYLEQAGTADRKRMEEAVLAGDIAWHALPFNWQTEMLDRSVIEGCVGLSASLDRRFGKKTIGAKMTDVPGHSRGIISPLAAADIKLLDIGVNPASTPPEVPEAFLWKDPDGSSLAVLYHHHRYGGCIEIPKSDLAIAIEMRDDNAGPHSHEEISMIYADLRQQYPDAAITAASLSMVATSVDALRDHLPVVTGEIGDTWIYGVPSDPIKTARYREVARMRREWITDKQFGVGDMTDLRLLQKLALAPEHTWGTDTKRFVDYDHYKPADLAKVIHQPGYQTMERSWQEKRDNVDAGLATLPPALQQQARLRLAALQATSPVHDDLTPHPAEQEVDTPHFLVALDPETGAITRLHEKASSRDWATRDHPLALFVYQALAAADYDTFLASYVLSKEPWAPRDFGKPEIGRVGAPSREWLPSLQQCWVGRSGDTTRILAELRIKDADTESAGRTAWPSTMFMDLQLPDNEAAVIFRFLSLGKAPNRMPESMWLSFAPDAPDAKGWVVEKVNQPVATDDVLQGGGRSMHAVTNYIRYRDARGYFQLTTMDAPVVAVGRRSPLNFSRDLPDLSEGFHVNLFNNAWGTNYLQWAGGDWLFRFKLEVG